MAKAVQATPEPDYGAKVAQESAEDAIAAAVPAPGVPPLDVSSNEAVSETGNMPVQGNTAPKRQPYTVKNPYMLLPAKVNFQQPQGKSPVEQQYDVGLLWRVLAESSASDDNIKTIAKRLLGGE